MGLAWPREGSVPRPRATATGWGPGGTHRGTSGPRLPGSRARLWLVPLLPDPQDERQETQTKSHTNSLMAGETVGSSRGQVAPELHLARTVPRQPGRSEEGGGVCGRASTWPFTTRPLGVGKGRRPCRGPARAVPAAGRRLGWNRGEEPVSGEPVVFSRRGPDGLHRPVSCTTISLPSRGGGLSPSLGSGLVTCGTVPRDLCRKDGEAGCPPGELWATRSEVTLMRPPCWAGA